MGDDAATQHDGVLTGDDEYWQHWWDTLHPAAGGEPEPMLMNAVVDASFAKRRWPAELDRDVVAYVVGRRLIAGRVIVPPETIDVAAAGLVEKALAIGVEVRVSSSPARFAIYNGRIGVSFDGRDPERGDRHVHTRRPARVAALQAQFDERWTGATPWGDYVRGGGDVLRLMARGWSDAQIAVALGVSGRTVSRRVAAAMGAAGARSRFELGMRYAQARLCGGENMTTCADER
ncbi:helix-turn-helix domain-containing protein [Microbacterium sp. LRZ72]|uniref:helix-turn-helix transcriptional regulator n=1 Tax=Microbacterium sp. LRZ72 TaxID=2942481 RepID=UPI0029ACC535|nr:helix-turn-helix domain-containing protein [Microbacterium sp. LRZ72]MDX2377102.1 helix-turn-helix domain-containing protein [Microbacterium sp. LRZ72]